MPYRLLDTAIWDDPRFEGCSMEAKLLYFFTNCASRGNQAGIFRISPDAIRLHTGIGPQELVDTFSQLEPWEIIYYPDQQIVWVKRFLRQQSRSPLFLKAAAKSLNSGIPDDLIEEFLAYNSALEIPYQKGIDTLSKELPKGTDTLSKTVTGKVSVTGSEEVTPIGARQRRATPDPRVKQILDEIKAYLGFPDRVDEDPIPNYGKEGQFIKKMLGRRFTPEQILEYWKGRIDAGGGDYLTAAWINEDIGKRALSMRRELPTVEELAASWEKGE